MTQFPAKDMGRLIFALDEWRRSIYERERYEELETRTKYNHHKQQYCEESGRDQVVKHLDSIG